MSIIRRVVNKRGELWVRDESSQYHKINNIPLLKYQHHQHQLAITIDYQLFHLPSLRLLGLHNVRQVIINNLGIPNYTHIVLMNDGQLLFIDVDNDGKIIRSTKTLNNVKAILPSNYPVLAELGILIDKWMRFEYDDYRGIIRMILGRIINESDLQPIDNISLNVIEIRGNVAVTSDGNYQLVCGKFVRDKFNNERWKKLRIDDDDYWIDSDGDTYHYAGYHLNRIDLPVEILRS